MRAGSGYADIDVLVDAVLALGEEACRNSATTP